MTSTPPSAPPSYPTIVDYDQYARTRERNDFWGQIKRTVNGKPVPESDIQLIVDAIKTHLAPQPGDIVLDLACGNGALSQRLFDSCAELVGVDISAYLIEVANEFFASAPRFVFTAAGADDYLRSEASPQRFTKVLCYGSFSYFTEDDARASLQLLHDRFTRVDTVFIGNLPDRDLAGAFYAPREPDPAEVLDPRAQIGIWRSKEEFTALAGAAGWDVTFSTMSSRFYAAHYRYDALLSRRRPCRAGK